MAQKHPGFFTFLVSRRLSESSFAWRKNSHRSLFTISHFLTHRVKISTCEVFLIPIAVFVIQATKLQQLSHR